MKKPNAQLDGQTLKLIILKFSDAWAQKIKDQGDVLTFHDGTIQQALTLFLQNMDAIPWNKDLDDILRLLERFTDRENAEAFISQVVNWYYGRFVDYDTRTKRGTNSAKLDFLRKSERDKTFNLSQGRFQCLTWKDTILFKTAFDLGIYQMLMWELKPKTILEIGSGTGGGAIWMSDLMTAFNIDCKIISVDIIPPAIQYKNVTFLKGDCYEIETALDAQMLNQLPHPWLVIEDAHANVLGVLNYLHQFLQQGDYLNIEDSTPKQEEIAAFLEDKKGSYMVDTLYVDFFGRNLTCSWDSIFRRE
jgi:cephalosporin hydroxylase